MRNFTLNEYMIWWYDKFDKNSNQESMKSVSGGWGAIDWFYWVRVWWCSAERSSRSAADRHAGRTTSDRRHVVCSTPHPRQRRQVQADVRRPRRQLRRGAPLRGREIPLHHRVSRSLTSLSLIWAIVGFLNSKYTTLLRFSRLTARQLV